MRWGILATGGIARAFASDLRLGGFDLRAVGSRSAASARAFASTYEIPHAHDSYESLVTDPDVDIVYVATPHPYHAEHAMLALNAGKHVLVEKPFAMNARQAQQIADLARAKGLVAMEAMLTRFLPHMVRIRQVIAAGVIGAPHTLVAGHLRALTDDPGHRVNSIELGGGALLDLGVYPISFASDLFGTPDTVTAQSVFRETGVDTRTAVTLKYGENRLASVLTASDTAGPNPAIVFGSEGRIEIASDWNTPSSFRVTDLQGRTLEQFAAPVSGSGMQFEAEQAERRVGSGSPGDVLTLSESVAIMRTLDRIREQIGLRYPADHHDPIAPTAQ